MTVRSKASDKIMKKYKNIRVGIIDGGGGMKGIYTAGIYDYLMYNKISIDYGIGVSAGAANLITYFADQKGRTYTFFHDYTFRKEYMSVSNWLKTRNYLNLDYIYSTLTNNGGENPLDYNTFAGKNIIYYAIATRADTGLPNYFTKEDISLNNYDVLKASCAIPVACKPYKVKGKLYFDGGVSDPIPYKKAFEDGCTHVIALLTRPKNFRKEKQKNMMLLKPFLRKYPNILNKLENRHILYNNQLEELIELEKSGKAIIIAPDDNCGVNTFTKDKEAFANLYQKGYEDGSKIKEYLKKIIES